ncbi:hypothetical protein Tfer_1762 [Thermincola ferriacetica]|uniref:Prenylated flavin chaperone LpdD-like domain-containing protein n=2 Tax=Thermincola ferriacetica TaxID=281456 RepID=A0A0L6W2B5_9FIRM|nr:hypothetical protein Tfer_1762 [Thermincola ferriacetica]
MLYRVNESMQEIRVSSGEGRYKINILAVITGEGIAVTLTGGEKPHVGGTTLSVPRTSLQDQGCLSCDTWITPVPGHKDAEMAASVGERLCRETGLVAAVVAGVHIDGAEDWEIRQLVANASVAADKLCHEIKKLQESSHAYKPEKFYQDAAERKPDNRD